MFYPNRKLRKSSKDAIVNFTNFQKCMNTDTDEAILPYKEAKLSYNFNVKNGALCTGYGVKELTLPKLTLPGERVIKTPGKDIKQLWKYRYYNQNLIL